jgi:hypothetical protein
MDVPLFRTMANNYHVRAGMGENLFPHRFSGKGFRGKNAPEINGLIFAAALNKKYANAMKSTT